MKDTCTAETARDFRQRYQGTFGCMIKENGEREWVNIAEVRDEDVVFNDRRGNAYQAVNGKGTEFEFTQVPMGWFNTPNGPVMFTRKPARQYQRGISRSNTTILNSTLRPIDLTLSRVHDAFSFQGMWEGQLPWALNKFFCINGENALLFFNEKIGVLKGSVLCVEKDCMVVQELQDTIARFNYPYTVKVED